MKKTSLEWIKEYDCKILDPDGWDRHNYDYSFNKEKIKRGEFERRLIMSTVQGSIYNDRIIREYKKEINDENNKS